VYLFFSDIKFDKHRELPPHPNVIQMFGVSLDGPQPVIVLEYCSGGIKSNQIKSNSSSSLDCVKKISRSYALLNFD
jgi:serine/threonine protein kinase